VTLRNRLFTGVVTALLLSTSPGSGLANFRADSLAFFGTWRWVSSAGGMNGFHGTPPPSGWRRDLAIDPDGTYALEERDSVGTYPICGGRCVIHRFGREAGRGTSAFWVDLKGWWWQFEEKMLVTFSGRDTILLYPGGEDFFVSDALQHTFVREVSSEPRLRTPPSGSRPPRLQNGFPGSYYAELPAQLSDLLRSKGAFHEWMDWQYPGPVRAAYTYTSNQVPSAVIGDFDGDGLADIAIHGSTGYKESKVVCILSNRGDPHAILLLAEPTLLDPPDNPDTTVSRFREPHPTLYLRLQPPGRVFENADGTKTSLLTDAILVVRPSGDAAVYYYGDGAFHTGRSLELSSQWSPTPHSKGR